MATLKLAEAGFGKKLGRVARMAAGGTILGGYAGILVGSVLGALLAIWQVKIFEGALLGALTFALSGGVYGTVLGLTERDQETT